MSINSYFVLLYAPVFTSLLIPESAISCAVAAECKDVYKKNQTIFLGLKSLCFCGTGLDLGGYLAHKKDLFLMKSTSSSQKTEIFRTKNLFWKVKTKDVVRVMIPVPRHCTGRV